jgi:tripartite-type tricarboxylate transporter receptor subunit TctC
MRHLGRRFTQSVSAGVLASLLALAPSPSQAQTQAWPARQPIRVIVPLSAGSAIDIVGRLVFEQVSKQIGQTVIIENRPGASQTLGAGAVAKADSDGYTILVAGSALAVVPSTIANLPFDVQTDLTAVASLANVPLVMVVEPGKGYKTIHDFVAAAKAGTFTYGSGGRGDSTHLAAERFRLAADFQGLYVPFRGAPEVLTEVMAGRLDFYMSPAAPALPLIAGGKLQALAVASAKRGAALPDIATTTELGFPNSDYEFWVGAFAPAATPRALVDRLNAEVLKALDTPGVRDRLKSIGGSATLTTAQAFGEQFKREIGVNAGLVKAVGLQTN